MPDGPDDPHTWPGATLVVRGGRRDVEHLTRVMARDGTWSVMSQPGVTFEGFAASVRNGIVRRTSVRAVHDAGGTLVPSRTGDAPPYHCDLSGLTAAALDAILEPEEPNPVPASSRWRGNPR